MWLELQIFGFRALWSPYFLLFIVTLGVLYFLITGPYRHKFGGDKKPTRKQRIYFTMALILLYMVKGAPVDLLSHIMLTAHMTQMAIYLLVVPIFIIKGIPEWLWKKFIQLPVIRTLLKFFTKPLISLVLFNALFSIYHIPIVFNMSKASPIAHTSISLLLFTTAFLMWFSLIPPVKEYDNKQPLQKIGLIFLNGVLITPACVLIIFAGEPLYAAYTSEGSWMQALSLCVPGDVLQGISTALSGPEMFSPLSIMADQQLGGIVMKGIQELTYGIVLGKVFFNWFSKDQFKIDPHPAETN